MYKIVLAITAACVAAVAAFGTGCTTTKSLAGTPISQTTPTLAVNTPEPASSPTPPSEPLRTAKYITVGSEIYEAALRDDAARVLQLCRQMDDALQQETDQRHDHDLLVDPCNLVVRGNSALSIKGQIGALIPPSEAHKQETVVAIDVQGLSNAAKASYKISYQLCSDDPAGTYRDSGTNSPEGAARWMSETWQVGAPRDGGYQGCLDGLLGNPSKAGP
jgi:hypothetical protein